MNLNLYNCCLHGSRALVGILEAEMVKTTTVCNGDVSGYLHKAIAMLLLMRGA